MTWTKLGDEFGVECESEGISDAAFRLHVEGLLWSNGKELDGRLPRARLARNTSVDDPERAARELVEAGFWRDEPSHYVIVHHVAEQPTREVLRARRALNADRQARHRRKRAGLSERPEREPAERPEAAEPEQPVTGDVTRDVTRYATRYLGSGRDGSGRAGRTEQTSRQEDHHAHERARASTHTSAPEPEPDDEHAEPASDAPAGPRPVPSEPEPVPEPSPVSTCACGERLLLSGRTRCERCRLADRRTSAAAAPVPAVSTLPERVPEPEGCGHPGERDARGNCGRCAARAGGWRTA